MAPGVSGIKLILSVMSPLKVEVLVSQLCLTLSDSIDSHLSGSSVTEFSGKNTEVGCHFLLQGIFLDPGIKPGSSALQADSLRFESPGKPHESLGSRLSGSNSSDQFKLFKMREKLWNIGIY